jgi:hypothetical protein
MADDDSEWDIETDSVAAESDESDTDDTSDDEWRFSVSDLPADDEEEDEQSAVGGNVFGSLSSDTEVIEAGSPGRESTLFVLVGAVLALLFFFQFYLLMG